MKNGVGSVKLVLEEFEDMWYVYNLVVKGDCVLGVIVCKVMWEMVFGVGEVECV